MHRIEVTSFGPILEANIEFGDLTVLVGPQASGKSLFVQLVKALSDAGAIRKELKSHGFDWLHGSDLIADYSSLYFGGGLQELITKTTAIRRDGKSVNFEKIAKPGANSGTDETVFLIPAQRVLVLQDGWPRPFMGYSAGDPYCMRRFSESLRLLMESGVGTGETLFPQPKRLIAALRTAVDDSIYIGFKLKIETEGLRKRVVLSRKEGESPLPFTVWSAGQREFTALLLGMYWLMPPTGAARRGALTVVVIEEPEMGLHPQAILSFCLLVLALLHRGYRVVLSTHSPVILDVIWALQSLKKIKQATAVNALREVFGITHGNAQLNITLQSALKKVLRVFYFDRTADGVIARDISSLDPGAEDAAVSGWGGLSGFSGRIAEAVGTAVAKGRR
jgi:AAA domain, putative AbiEii toxin, Type IV TA system